MAGGRTAVGVDIGGTHIRAARVSESGEILARTRIRSDHDPERAMAAIAAAIEAVDAPDAEAIGIGVPGRVDAATGEVLSGGYVDLSGLPVRSRIEAAFGRSVTIDNDCAMALVAEAAIGAARGLKNAVMLTIGTGIGGAVMDGGHLVHGRRTAGQLGHIVVETEGLRCVCGKRGCVETTSSGTALGRLIAEAGLPGGTTAADLRAAAANGDAAATNILQRWAVPLRAAIDSLVAALDPEVVLLGGGLGSEAASAVAALPNQTSWYESHIAAAALGDDAGVIGGALAALERTSAATAKPPASPAITALRPTAAVGRRAILVNGVPASGKSGVARALAAHTGWPILGLDTVKNPFLELIENVDRPFNRVLGRASYKAIFSIIGEAPAGSTFIVDAWFGFQPPELLEEHLAMAKVA
ncbi:transcriptional regulator, partial [Kaistia algarum]